MQTLTLIPNADTEGVMVLIVLILGSFNIARHIHLRWLKNHFSFVASNALIKWLIVLAGLLILPARSLFDGHLQHELLAAALGIVLGMLTVQLESYLLRLLNRRMLINKVNRQTHTEHSSLRSATINKKLSLSSKSTSAKGISTIRQSHTRHSQSPDFLNYSLSAVILVAIAEECLFRGYLHTVSATFTNLFVYTAFIILSIFIFAFSHVSTRWTECTNKLPLAIFSMLAIVITESLTSAIMLHVILNINAWRQMRNWQSPQGAIT